MGTNVRSMELHIQHQCTSQAKRLCVHRAESQTHIGSLQQRKESRRALSKEVVDKPQIHSNWVFEFEFLLLLLFVCCLRRTKRLGLIIVFSYFLIVVSGAWMLLVYDPVAQWSRAQGSVSSSYPGETT